MRGLLRQAADGTGGVPRKTVGKYCGPTRCRHSGERRGSSTGLGLRQRWHHQHVRYCSANMHGNWISDRPLYEHSVSIAADRVSLIEVCCNVMQPQQCSWSLSSYRSRGGHGEGACASINPRLGDICIRPSQQLLSERCWQRLRPVFCHLHRLNVTIREKHSSGPIMHECDARPSPDTLKNA